MISIQYFKQKQTNRKKGPGTTTTLYSGVLSFNLSTGGLPWPSSAMTESNISLYKNIDDENNICIPFPSRGEISSDILSFNFHNIKTLDLYSIIESIYPNEKNDDGSYWFQLFFTDKNNNKFNDYDYASDETSKCYYGDKGGGSGETNNDGCRYRAIIDFVQNGQYFQKVPIYVRPTFYFREMFLCIKPNEEPKLCYHYYMTGYFGAYQNNNQINSLPSSPVSGRVPVGNCSFDIAGEISLRKIDRDLIHVVYQEDGLDCTIGEFAKYRYIKNNLNTLNMDDLVHLNTENVNQKFESYINLDNSQDLESMKSLQTAKNGGWLRLRQDQDITGIDDCTLYWNPHYPEPDMDSGFKCLEYINDDIIESFKTQIPKEVNVTLQSDGYYENPDTGVKMSCTPYVHGWEFDNPYWLDKDWKNNLKYIVKHKAEIIG